MIPRKEAEKLLAELAERVHESEAVDRKVLAAHVSKVAGSSDLVLRGAENVEQKGRRLLAEGRLQIVKVIDPEGDDPLAGFVMATCRGTDGEYKLGFDPKRKQWRCTCIAKSTCSHLVALKLVIPPRAEAQQRSGRRA